MVTDPAGTKKLAFATLSDLSGLTVIRRAARLYLRQVPAPLLRKSAARRARSSPLDIRRTRMRSSWKHNA